MAGDRHVGGYVKCPGRGVEEGGFALVAWSP
jgi:hypothetical protein